MASRGWIDRHEVRPDRYGRLHWMALLVAAGACVGAAAGAIGAWRGPEPKALRPVELPVCGGAGADTMALTGDGSKVVVACGRRTLEWWAIATRRKVGSISLPPGKGHWSLERGATRIARVTDEGHGTDYGIVDRRLIALPPHGPGHHRFVPKGFEQATRAAGDEGCRFSPDGMWMESDNGEPAGVVKLWKPGQAHPTHIVKAGSGVLCVDFSPDGAYVAVGTHRAGATVWRLANSKIASEVDAMLGDTTGLDDDHVLAVRFSPDSHRLAVGRLSGNVELWDARRSRCIAAGHTSAMAQSCVEFGLGSALLVSWGGHGRVFTWDIRGL